MIRRIGEADLKALMPLYEGLTGKKMDLALLIDNFRVIEGDDHYLLLGIFDDDGILRGSVTLSRCLDLTVNCRYYYSLENLIFDENCCYGCTWLHHLQNIKPRKEQVHRFTS